MKCKKCNNVELGKERRFLISPKEGGDSYTCLAYRCPKCGKYYMASAERERYHRKINEVKNNEQR